MEGDVVIARQTQLGSRASHWWFKTSTAGKSPVSMGWKAGLCWQWGQAPVGPISGCSGLGARAVRVLPSYAEDITQCY